MSLLDVSSTADNEVRLARSPSGRLYVRRGDRWELYDFNEMYRGYYPACTFTALTYAGGMFHLAGVDEQGHAHVFSSLAGNVWEERNLVSLQPMEEPIRLKGKVSRILFDDESEQLFLICANGQLATLPDCPKCVKIIRLRNSPAEDGWFDEDCIVVRFADGSTQRIPKYDAVQYRVSLGYACRCLRQGAVLVDLRTPDEYSAGHLRGSINIPFELLGEDLRKIDPRKLVIFVCRIGIKADEAVSYARKNGYSRAYSLGGINILSHIE
jgi:rhodanese-related sulfurtransferase